MSAATLAVVAMVHGWAIKDLWIGDPGDAGGAGTLLRIISANVLGTNATPDQAAGFWPAEVAIDHVLVRGPLVSHDIRCGPFIGSDHYPLIADLRLVIRQQP